MYTNSYFQIFFLVTLYFELSVYIFSYASLVSAIQSTVIHVQQSSLVNCVLIFSQSQTSLPATSEIIGLKIFLIYCKRGRIIIRCTVSVSFSFLFLLLISKNVLSFEISVIQINCFLDILCEILGSFLQLYRLLITLWASSGIKLSTISIPSCVCNNTKKRIDESTMKTQNPNRLSSWSTFFRWIISTHSLYRK